MTIRTLHRSLLLALALALAIAGVGVSLAVLPAASASADHPGCSNSRPDSWDIWARPFSEHYAGFGFALTRTFDGSPPCDHTGTDWDLADGGQRTFPVYAADNGWVTHAAIDPQGCFGRYTTISSAPEGIVLAYAHLSTQVSSYDTGDPIRKGVLIGYAGSSGTCAEFTHLHLSATKSWHGWYSSATVMFSARAFLGSNGVHWLAGE